MRAQCKDLGAKRQTAEDWKRGGRMKQISEHAIRGTGMTFGVDVNIGSRVLSQLRLGRGRGDVGKNTRSAGNVRRDE